MPDYLEKEKEVQKYQSFPGLKYIDASYAMQIMLIFSMSWFVFLTAEVFLVIAPCTPHPANPTPVCLKSK